jgi:hypothetical protein
MAKTQDLDPGTLPAGVRTALEAAAEARAICLKAGDDVIRANTARAIEERIRERLTGETMMRPDAAFSRYIDQRAREIAGLPACASA